MSLFNCSKDRLDLSSLLDYVPDGLKGYIGMFFVSFLVVCAMRSGNNGERYHINLNRDDYRVVESSFTKDKTGFDVVIVTDIESNTYRLVDRPGGGKYYFGTESTGLDEIRKFFPDTTCDYTIRPRWAVRSDICRDFFLHLFVEEVERAGGYQYSKFLER